MRALCAALGCRSAATGPLHVVGTNGKSSVTTMTAALLRGAGLADRRLHLAARLALGGADPDRRSRDRRRRVRGRDGPGRRRDRRRRARLRGGRAVTQFEAAIAASFVAFAAAGVDVAVVEAGLGGRLDATNVIPSRATALTSVGLDHTEWLGETELEIAAEKLAVLREGTTLVIGRLAAEVADYAPRTSPPSATRR